MIVFSTIVCLFSTPADSVHPHRLPFVVDVDWRSQYIIIYFALVPPHLVVTLRGLGNRSRPFGHTMQKRHRNFVYLACSDALIGPEEWRMCVCVCVCVCACVFVYFHDF